MSDNKVNQIVGLVVILIMAGVLLPIALSGFSTYTGAYNRTVVVGTDTSYVTGTNTTIGTLVSTVIPIIIVIGLIVGMISYKRNRGAMQ